MQVVVLIGFVVALTLANEGPLLAGGWVAGLAVVMYLAGAVAMGAFKTALSLRAIGRRDDVPAGVLRRHNLMTVVAQCWLILGLAGAILIGYGQWVLRDLHLGRIPLVGQIVLVGPFVVALLLSWLLEYPFYREVRGRIAHQQMLMGVSVRTGWTLREYLDYNVRHHLLFVAVPVGLILLAKDLLLLARPLFGDEIGGHVVLGGTVACAAVVFVCAPLLIVRIWRTKRLPDGGLRDDLVRACRQMKLKCRDILVWRSGGMIANAGVMGIIGPVRYVLLSDALLEHMDNQQVKAIFAHEAGHITSHHLLYSMLFAVSAAALAASAGELLAEALRLGPESWIAETAAAGLLAVAWGVGFGWLSRRFERQSDVIGAWASGPDGPTEDGRITPEGAAVFSRSLESVAQLNGIPPGQRSWRHGSINSRVRYILWLGSTGGGRRQIDRLVRRVKVGLWSALAVAGLIVVVRLALGV